MKTLIIFILIILEINNYAQEIDSMAVVRSPYGTSFERLDASMHVLAPHGFLTQFSYFEVNFTKTRLADFLEKKMHMELVGIPKFNNTKNGLAIIEKYKKATNIDDKDQYLYVKYNLIDKWDYSIIKSCEISGYWDFILDLYITYWNTTLNFDAAKKGELVVNNFLQDRVALSLNPSKEYGKIDITSTTIKAKLDYDNVIKQNIKLFQEQ